jgi:hypothetical protein
MAADHTRQKETGPVLKLKDPNLPTQSKTPHIQLQQVCFALSIELSHDLQPACCAAYLRQHIYEALLVHSKVQPASNASHCQFTKHPAHVGTAATSNSSKASCMLTHTRAP